MRQLFETLIKKNDRVVSIVGAGGKTSLMFLLAHADRQRGLKVISTTTTRILKPTSRQSAAIILTQEPEFDNKLREGLNRLGHVTVAHRFLPTGDKLEGIDPALVGKILDHSPADRIIIEADGARKLSFKAPGDSEPVVPERTDIFISLVGLDIIGKPLDEIHVFRAEQVAERTGLRIGDEITPRTVAKLSSHPKGLLKGCPQKARRCIFLNKTDIPGGRKKALAVIEAAKRSEGKKPDFWIAGSIRKDRLEIYQD